MDRLKNILKFAMKLESQGEKFYTYYADQVKNPNNKKLLQNLAQIEHSHYLFLKKKYDELYFAKDLHDIAWVVDSKNIIHPSIFSSAADHLNMGNDDDAISDLAILRIAYTIEDDFANFYRTAAEQVDFQDAKDFLLTLAAWEDEHREIFHKGYSQQLKASWGDLASMILK
ncbi:MAG: ferritin family protein [Firmicutes bacterium]|nr:ferritin family protein [Bacillota bacterium]